MAYPNSFYNPRTIENLPGVVYDANKKKVFFAEDLNGETTEIKDIEITLGLLDDFPFVPPDAVLNLLLKDFYNRWQAKVDIGLVAGGAPIATVSFQLLSPMDVTHTAEVTVSGGSFTVDAFPLPLVEYNLLVSAKHMGFNVFQFRLMYYDIALGVFVPPPAVPPGAIITGDPSFTYVVKWTPIP